MRSRRAVVGVSVPATYILLLLHCGGDSSSGNAPIDGTVPLDARGSGAASDAPGPVSDAPGPASDSASSDAGTDDGSTDATDGFSCRQRHPLTAGTMTGRVIKSPNGSKIPVAFAPLGTTTTGNLSDKEILFIKSHASYVAYQSFNVPGSSPLSPLYRYNEDGVYAHVARTRAMDGGDDTVILIYWGFHGGDPNYCAYQDPVFQEHKCAWRGDGGYDAGPDSGDSVCADAGDFNIGDPDFQDWWAEAAARMVADNDLDGIWVDGVENTPTSVGDGGEDSVYHHTTDILSKLRADLDALSMGHKYIFVNALAAPPDASNSIFNYVDGCMIEHYDYVIGDSVVTAADNSTRLQNMIAFSDAGKMVQLKTWPYPYSADSEGFGGWSYADKVDAGRHNIGFELASYLIGSFPGRTFLQYSWGYNDVGGDYILSNYSNDAAPNQDWSVDPTWYPEFLNTDVGTPMGLATNDGGYGYTRRFKNGPVITTVTVDLNTRDVSITSSP